jgi:hypothetical protein
VYGEAVLQSILLAVNTVEECVRAVMSILMAASTILSLFTSVSRLKMYRRALEALTLVHLLQHTLTMKLAVYAEMMLMLILAVANTAPL